MSLLFTKTSVNITQSSAVMGNHEHERETKLDYGIRQQACSLYTHVSCGPLHQGRSTLLITSYRKQSFIFQKFSRCLSVRKNL